MAENISPERAIDAFRDGLIRRDFKEKLGCCYLVMAPRKLAAGAKLM
jgi:hypothetical protein